MQLQDIARVCHEVNRVFCEGLGDTSQTSWDHAPDWQKESAVNGVRYAVEGIRSGQPRTPEDMHASWYMQKLAEGWVYGPVKDAERKEHPCMVSYGNLPVEQRAKDILFSAVVKGLLPRLTE